MASECPLSPQALVPSADLLTMTTSSATGTHSFRLHTSNSVSTAASSVQTLVPCVVRRPTMDPYTICRFVVSVPEKLGILDVVLQVEDP